MNLPTKITVSRIVASAVIFVTLLTFYIISRVNPSFATPCIELANVKIDVFFIILLVVFIIVALTDMVDGKLARARNEVTTLGKFLDPIADKLLVNSMLIFLSAVTLLAPYNKTNPVSISVWCVILMIVRDIVVDSLRMIAVNKHVVIAANICGKMKTVFQMIAIGVVLANDFPFAFFDQNFPIGLRISDILVYIATAISLLSGIIYVVENKHVFNED